MKKHLSLFPLLCAVILLFSGCADTAAKEPLTEKFTCDFSVDYQDMQFAGIMQRSNAGTLTMSLKEPKTLSGLTVSHDGEKTTASLGILEYTLDEKLPQASAVNTILDVLDDLFEKAQSGKLIDDGMEFTGKTDGFDYRMLSDPDTGVLMTLEVPDMQLNVKFSGMRKGE